MVYSKREDRTGVRRVVNVARMEGGTCASESIYKLRHGDVTTAAEIYGRETDLASVAYVGVSDF
jgi:hypothetical protein